MPPGLSGLYLIAGFALKHGGRLDASGTIIPGKASGRLDLDLTGVSLQAFASYVNQVARLNLRSGVASTRCKLVFTQKAGRKLDFDGGFAVDDLAITDEIFLGGKKLSSGSLDSNSVPIVCTSTSWWC